jgi:hypothetical protein
MRDGRLNGEAARGGADIPVDWLACAQARVGEALAAQAAAVAGWRDELSARRAAIAELRHGRASGARS